MYDKLQLSDDFLLRKTIVNPICLLPQKSCLIYTTILPASLLRISLLYYTGVSEAEHSSIKLAVL
jgi:hypothetical protein